MKMNNQPEVDCYLPEATENTKIPSTLFYNFIDAFIEAFSRFKIKSIVVTSRLE